LLAVFGAQHHGILRTARIQTVIGVAVILPLLIVGVVPLLTGDVLSANFSPFAPLPMENNQPVAGPWYLHGFTLVLVGLLLAAWSTQSFETAICYTLALKTPKSEPYKAIFYSGLLCPVVFILVPFAFQGALGVAGMLDPGIVSGAGVGTAMAKMVGGG